MDVPTFVTQTPDDAATKIEQDKAASYARAKRMHDAIVWLAAQSPGKDQSVPGLLAYMDERVRAKEEGLAVRMITR